MNPLCPFYRFGRIGKNFCAFVVPEFTLSVTNVGLPRNDTVSKIIQKISFPLPPLASRAERLYNDHARIRSAMLPVLPRWYNLRSHHTMQAGLSDNSYPFSLP